MQRRSSLRLFKGIDEEDSTLNQSYHSNTNNDEEDRANRATKELVERVQKQNEEFKKSNHQLKLQMDSMISELIQANLERAELLTEIDRQKLEKRRLKDKLQWYEWSNGLWEVTRYISSSLYGNNQQSNMEYPPEPDIETLHDTE